MKQLSLKTQQRSSVFGTCFDVSKIIISHYEYTVMWEFLDLFGDKNFHIFKHLSGSKGCKDKCDISCFKIIDHASTHSQLKVKESFHIEQLKPELNKQVDHVSEVCRCISKFNYCCLQVVFSLLSVISCLCLSFYWLV